MKVIPVLLFAAAVLCAVDSNSQPITVWNTFQEPGDQDLNYGAAILGTASGVTFTPYQGVACDFIPSASGYLNSLFLAIAGGNPPSNGMNVFVAANNNNLPGNILESFLNVSSPLDLGPNYTPPITLSSSLHPYLNQGVTYWVYVEPSTPTTHGLWDNAIANPNNPALGTFETAPGAWRPATMVTQQQAFAVTVVPEPSTFALVLAGLLGYPLARRFRRATTTT